MLLGMCCKCQGGTPSYYGGASGASGGSSSGSGGGGDEYNPYIVDDDTCPCCVDGILPRQFRLQATKNFSAFTLCTALLEASYNDVILHYRGTLPTTPRTCRWTSDHSLIIHSASCGGCINVPDAGVGTADGPIRPAVTLDMQFASTPCTASGTGCRFKASASMVSGGAVCDETAPSNIAWAWEQNRTTEPFVDCFGPYELQMCLFPFATANGNSTITAV